MRVLREEGNYWISEDQDHFFLMHRIDRPEIKSYSEFCVGEAFPRRDGIIEVRIAFVSDRLAKSGQILVGIVDSPVKALEVLWQQRDLLHFGVYQ